MLKNTHLSTIYLITVGIFERDNYGSQYLNFCIQYHQRIGKAAFALDGAQLTIEQQCMYLAHFILIFITL